MAEESKAIQEVVEGDVLALPRYAVSTFNLTAIPTEICLLANVMVPGLSAGALAWGHRPEFILSLSPQAAKELVVLLSGAVELLEKEIGEISTPFLRERAGK